MPAMSRATRRSATSVLSALGLGPEDERRYHQVLPLSGVNSPHIFAPTLGSDMSS